MAGEGSEDRTMRVDRLGKGPVADYGRSSIGGTYSRESSHSSDGALTEGDPFGLSHE